MYDDVSFRVTRVGQIYSHHSSAVLKKTINYSDTEKNCTNCTYPLYRFYSGTRTPACDDLMPVILAVRSSHSRRSRSVMMMLGGMLISLGLCGKLVKGIPMMAITFHLR